MRHTKTVDTISSILVTLTCDALAVVLPAGNLRLLFKKFHSKFA